MLNTSNVFKVVSSLLTVAMVSAVIMLFSLTVFAAGEAFSGGSDISGSAGQQIAIDDLSITGTGDDEITVNLYAEDGGLEFGSTTGLTFDGSDTGSNLTFTGLRSDINAALATLVFSGDNLGEYTIDATIVSGDGEVFNPSNGHVYQTVFAVGINWYDANTAAELLEYNGSSGYLATITTQEEDEFIRARLSNDGWIGASDADDQGTGEGDWNWVGGDDAGTSFWSGGIEGSPVGESYANWDYPNQPDNAGDEDCGQIMVGSSGAWNDLTCTNVLDYYVVEFGAEGDLPTVASTQINVTVDPLDVEVGDCEELQALGELPGGRTAEVTLTSDIDCEGQPTESLFDDDSQPFEGSVDGQGHTIMNVVIDETEDESENVGIFGSAANATFDNIKLRNITVIGAYDVGALIGDIDQNTSVNDVHARNVDVSAISDGDDGGYVGGLIGDIDFYDFSAQLTNLSVTGTVSSIDGDNVGGLVGMIQARNSSILIQQVFSDVDVITEGSDDVGGLIGELESSDDSGADEVTGTITLQDAYTWGDVSVPDGENVGGLLGRADIEDEFGEADMIIRRTYARGSVLGDLDTAGLVGQFDEPQADSVYALSNNFAMGEVEILEVESERVGALVGYTDESVESVDSTNNYFDQTGTGQSECGDGLAGCTAVNTDGSDEDYFINNNNNAPMDVWDFEDIWVANSGIPPVFQAYSEEDGDNDGANDIVENAGPNDGDANNDGTSDSEQANVASMIDPVSGEYAVLEVDEQCAIESIEIVSESEVSSDEDSKFDYPAGLMDFRIDCGEDGFVATITQYYYAIEGDFEVRKFKPDTGYFTIDGASTEDQTISGQQVKVATYQVEDGSDLDLDAEVNGSIEDPAGLGEGEASEDLADSGDSTDLNMLPAALAGLLITIGTALLIQKRRIYSRQ